MDLYRAAEKLVDWLEGKLLVAGRGDELTELDVEPAGKFWLGRLASEEAVIALRWGERGERIDPCAVGIRLKPTGVAPGLSKCARVPVRGYRPRAGLGRRHPR